jgi:hypothetical protein
MKSIKKILVFFSICFSASSCVTIPFEENHIIEECTSRTYRYEPSSKIILGFNYTGKDRSFPMLGNATVYNLETGDSILTDSRTTKNGEYYNVSFSHFFLEPGVYAIVDFHISYNDGSKSASNTFVFDIEDEAPWFVVAKENKNLFLGTICFIGGTNFIVDKKTEILDLLIKKHKPELTYEIGHLIEDKNEKIKIAKHYKLSRVNFE